MPAPGRGGDRDRRSARRGAGRPARRRRDAGAASSPRTRGVDERAGRASGGDAALRRLRYGRTPENAHPDAFCNVDVDTAAARLAEILVEEGADVLTIYDPNGGYGHPDHVQVHHVGVRAAELANVAHVYEAAVSRDHIRRMMAANPEWSEEATPPDFETFGLSDDEITTVVDVTAALAAKRAAMLAHETQIGDFGPFLQMPEEQLHAAFGQEWFRRRGAPSGLAETALPL